MQLEAISFQPVICLGEETTTYLAAQAKQPQFLQLLLIRLVFWILSQICCPSLDMFQHLNVLLGVRSPKLTTGFEVWSCHYPKQDNDHFLGPV